MPTLDPFSQRKKDHINISLQDESQAYVDQFSSIELQHCALPEMNFDEVSIDCDVFGHPLKSPLFVSSMTLGHSEASAVNHSIAKCASQRGWMMGVGSQRRQLFDKEAARECEVLRESFQQIVFFGNIGLSQVIATPTKEIQNLVDSLEAQFMVVHTNPLQECIQPEGTPQFKGGLASLKNLCQELTVPVVLKETGCGFSQKTFNQLQAGGLSSELAAIDVSGMGGTHWGRVEGLRQNPVSKSYQVAASLENWGVSTVDSLFNALETRMDCEIWASGGVRNGLDAAKCLALGATKVGYARPVLQSVMQGEQELLRLMEKLEFELKVSMFCMGVKTLSELIGEGSLWKKI